MGTPDFAVRPLKKLAAAGHEIAAVFTQPDRQKGRGKKFTFSDVKQAALDMGLENCIYQPAKLREQEYVDIIRNINPDAIVVAAYGQILTEDVLNIPKYGCINIHASLLPKYRGAAPIEAAILNGDEKTGVTIMYMAKGLDTGDMIASTEVPISGDDTTESLTLKLSEAGAELIVDALKSLEAGTAERTPQNDDESSYCGKLDKEMGRIDFSHAAAEIERRIRAMYPWPCAFTGLNGKTLKILGARVVDDQEVDEMISDNDLSAKLSDPGTVIIVTKKNFTVKCGSGALTITSLQPEGKKVMDCNAFLNGYDITVGEKLG
jgi:methionyl-tRNA formyltransferase (EC 2.1.2.9)